MTLQKWTTILFISYYQVLTYWVLRIVLDVLRIAQLHCTSVYLHHIAQLHCTSAYFQILRIACYGLLIGA